MQLYYDQISSAKRLLCPLKMDLNPTLNPTGIRGREVNRFRHFLALPRYNLSFSLPDVSQ